MDIHAEGREPRPTRVVVGISGSLGSLAALHRAVDEAHRRDAEVLAVLAWQPPGGEHGYRRSPCPPVLAAVRAAAADRLRTALDNAFGSAGPTVPLHAELVRAEPGAALAALADRPEDLLVVGAGSGNWLRRGMRPSVTRFCVRRASCPVLVVPRPAMLRELDWPRRLLRSWDTHEAGDAPGATCTL
ncbi:universal stress protein [Kitasatospora sp. NPDC088346]|uniref:universal stress protein n=1 Tax=Kitasatospora sp. NPDC088346 TaxID=3364073 RepID=UPI00380DD41E